MLIASYLKKKYKNCKIKNKKFTITSHFGRSFCLPMITITEYTMHMSRLMMIAETPNVMITSLRYETGTILSVPCATGFRDSSLPRKIKSKKQQLQIMVNREKKEITFIENNSLKILSPK
ncbi:MAG: hypothetical protein ABI863_16310 [Ginsengibacter sp.]